MGVADVSPSEQRAIVEREAFLQSVKDVAVHAARGEVERARGEEGGLPQDVLTELRRPFAPAAIKWKIQVETKKGAIVVAHLDARLVIERLNKVCGLNWSDAYRPMSTNWQWCDLTMMGVTRSDCGTGRDGKAQVSDALKRAGVKFGIGVSIYAMSAVMLDRGDEPYQLRYQQKRKKTDKGWTDVEVPTLDKKTLDWLRDTYEKWVAGRGSVFGEIFEHGDQADAMGLEEDAEIAPVQDDGEAAEVVQLEGEDADECRQTARDAFETLRERGEMLPGEFNRRLTAAGGSLEALREFADELVGQAAREPEAKP